MKKKYYLCNLKSRERELFDKAVKSRCNSVGRVADL